MPYQRGVYNKLSRKRRIPRTYPFRSTPNRKIGGRPLRSHYYHRRAAMVAAARAQFLAKRRLIGKMAAGVGKSRMRPGYFPGRMRLISRYL